MRIHCDLFSLMDIGKLLVCTLRWAATSKSDHSNRTLFNITNKSKEHFCHFASSIANGQFSQSGPLFLSNYSAYSIICATTSLLRRRLRRLPLGSTWMNIDCISAETELFVAFHRTNALAIVYLRFSGRKKNRLVQTVINGFQCISLKLNEK